MIDWKEITALEDIEQIVGLSYHQPILIYKHSTRCTLCDIAKLRLESDRELLPQDVGYYILDLLRYRSVSNEIAERFSVQHESPQIVVIQNGECTLDESHMDIQMESLAEFFSTPTRIIP